MNARRVESFLLRVIVQEDGSDRFTLAWRGRIKHVTTGNERQFEQLGEVLAFIAAHTGHEEAALPQPLPDA